MKNCTDDTVIDVDDEKKSKECIFRVPRVLRRQKPEAYTPDVVSIGPFHYRAREKRANRNDEGKEDDFQLMERVKQSYLKEILSHMGEISLEELTATVTDKLSKEGGGFEKRARGFYAEPLDHIPSEDFKVMMIVDGCFLIQLFRKCKNEDLQKGNDPVFNMDCMFHFLCHDIVLLENQLPWFVLTTLYRLTHDIYSGELPLSALVLEAFTKLPSLKDSCSSKFNGDDDFRHILDLIRTSMVVLLEDKSDAEAVTEVKSDGKAVPEDKFDPNQHQIRTAAALSKADIKFRNHKKDKKGKKEKKDMEHKEESIMNIKFEVGGFWRNGVLRIPQLNVGILSLTLFRNLIAIEQCYHYHGRYSNAITSYAILMDNLISSKEDMELLSKAQVIGNWLSDEDGCNFFNNLHKDIPHNNFCYKELCQEVNERYKMRRYTWLALLKIENFSNPWKILAFGFGIVAVFLSSWASINNIRKHM